ncbi:MAG: hypothetical protein NUV91_03490 [Candidatus Omnitrophica bacterium]|nr:hypothetical protein [Candidatus Omnitrophota bacterium]
MNLEEFKSLIPDFLEGNLSSQDEERMQHFMIQSVEAQKEMDAYKKTWDMLGEWKEIEPDPGYISRFWTRLAQERPWYQKFLEALWDAISNKVVMPVAVAACLVVWVASITLKTTLEVQTTETALTELSGEEFEMMENLELVENYDVIEQMDMLEDTEIIDSLGSFEVS